MSNEILWLLFAIVNFILIVSIYELFGKTGLFAWIAIGTILANIQVTKSIDFQVGNFVIAATLGNIMYGTLFLVTDALGEKYSRHDAKKAVQIGFFSLILFDISKEFSIISRTKGISISSNFSLKAISKNFLLSNSL